MMKSINNPFPQALKSSQVNPQSNTSIFMFTTTTTKTYAVCCHLLHGLESTSSPCNSPAEGAVLLFPSGHFAADGFKGDTPTPLRTAHTVLLVHGVGAVHLNCSQASHIC